MADGLHIPIWNRTKKPLAIALSAGVGRGLRGRDNGGNVTNVQYKCNQNCHYKFPLHNEYILIKIYYKNAVTRGGSEAQCTWPSPGPSLETCSTFKKPPYSSIKGKWDPSWSETPQLCNVLFSLGKLQNPSVDEWFLKQSCQAHIERESLHLWKREVEVGGEILTFRRGERLANWKM
jgi:hypothetical protein